MTDANDNRNMPQADDHQQCSRQSSEKNAVGIGRRAFLAASAAATMIAGSRTSFAQKRASAYRGR